MDSRGIMEQPATATRPFSMDNLQCLFAVEQTHALLKGNRKYCAALFFSLFMNSHENQVFFEESSKKIKMKVLSSEASYLGRNITKLRPNLTHSLCFCCPASQI